MHTKKVLIVVCVLALVTLACSTQSLLPTQTPYPTSTPYPSQTPYPTFTPYPTNTATPTIDQGVPVPTATVLPLQLVQGEARGTSLTFVGLSWIDSYNDQNGTANYPNSGSAFLRIIAIASGGYIGSWPQDLSVNDVHIMDNRGLISWWNACKYPDSSQAGIANWVFEVPASYNFQTLWIILPDGVTVDLLPLLPPTDASISSGSGG